MFRSTLALRISTESNYRFQNVSIVSYHSSNYLCKKSQFRQFTPKQMEAFKNSPAYQGMLKVQNQRMEYAKTLQEEPGSEIKNRPMTFISTNKMLDPNIPKPPPPMSDIQFWITPLKSLFSFINTNVIHFVRLRNLLSKKKIPKNDYTGKIMKSNAEALYMRYHQDHLSGKVEDLITYCSEQLASEVIKEVEKRPKVFTIDVKWDCEIKSIKLLSMRVMSVPAPISKDFVQVTYRFITEQGYTLRDKKTEEIVKKKDPEPVTNYFGFERALEENSHWIIVEKLKSEL